MTRQVFDGWIAGIGTQQGTRLVLGHWAVSPFGTVTDVTLETPDGHRTLLAPRQEVAEFVAATYEFDAVRVVPVEVDVGGDRWRVTAGPLRLSCRTGRRTALGWLLRLVPRRLAGARWWVVLTDLPARTLLRGVRTRGSARSGRRQWYAARDIEPVLSASVELAGVDLGGLANVDPPVRFGFGSVPRRPSLVRVTTTVEVAVPQAWPA